MTGLSLSRVLSDFPDVQLQKVDVLANKKRAREDGVRMIPALVSGDRKVSGIIMGPKKIRRFLESLSADSG